MSLILRPDIALDNVENLLRRTSGQNGIVTPLSLYIENAVILKKDDDGLFENLSPYNKGPLLVRDGMYLEQELSYAITRKANNGSCSYNASVFSCFPYETLPLVTREEFKHRAESLEGYQSIQRNEVAGELRKMYNEDNVIFYHNSEREVTLWYCSGSSRAWFIPAGIVEGFDPLTAKTLNFGLFQLARTVSISLISEKQRSYEEVIDGFAQYAASTFNQLVPERRIDERILQKSIEVAIESNNLLSEIM